MPGDGADRLDYMRDSVDLLWPSTDSSRPAAVERVVLPSARTPRLLVPTRPRRAAASAVVRYTAQQPAADRARSLVLAAAIMGGLCHRRPAVVPRDDAKPGESIDAHLSAVLDRQVVTSLALTSGRANRKPVLQVFDTRGHTLAFGKLGISAGTDALVAHEAATLTELAGHDMTHVAIPDVLHLGQWRGHTLLVSSTLPYVTRRAFRGDTLDRAMREIAGIATWRNADYATSSRAQATTLLESRPNDGVTSQWLELFDAVAVSSSSQDLAMGAWHGDWTPWNCVPHGGRLGVWDWERFTGPVPLGFDKLHFILMRDSHERDLSLAEASLSLIDAAPGHLAPWGIPAERAVATSLYYLLSLALRYLVDDARATTKAGIVEGWALPAVRSALGA